MAKRPGRPENLNPPFTPEQAREIGRKGGIASAEAKKKRKFLSELYADMLADEYEITINKKKTTISGAQLFKMVAKEILMKRNHSTVMLMKEMREATEGSKFEFTGDPDAPAVIKIEFVTKNADPNK